MSMKRSVFKKASPNNKIVVYLGRRDIFDDLTTVDPIDGVITMDQAYVKGRKIYARIQCAFRYGQENLDNIMTGVTFMKEFFINTDQIYPIDKRKPQHKLTIVQERLIERFGSEALPFKFEMPHDVPSSIVLQLGSSAESINSQPCGIEYSLQVFVGEAPEATAHKHNSVIVTIRRLTIAIPGPTTQPYTKAMRKNFHLHSGELKIEAQLPKEIFYHGEIIPVTIQLDNLSSNTVRRIKFQVIQLTDITLFRQQQFKTVVFSLESEEGFPIEAGTMGWTQTYKLRPLLFDNRHQPGLALDGKMKHQDTNLATSTLIKDYRKRDLLGIIVQYLIRLKIVTGFGGRDTEMDIPFILTHPRKEVEQSMVGGPDEVVIEKFSRTKIQQHSETPSGPEEPCDKV